MPAWLANIEVDPTIACRARTGVRDAARGLGSGASPTTTKSENRPDEQPWACRKKPDRA